MSTKIPTFLGSFSLRDEDYAAFIPVADGMRTLLTCRVSMGWDGESKGGDRGW